jgi:hypothetical protein
MKNTTAFPINKNDDTDGMTLRDYFAAKAMQGLIPTYDENMVKRELAHTLHLKWTEQLVTEAYNIADAMLKEREKC